MAVAVVLTVITGLDYVYRALTLRQTSARAMRAAAARRAAGPTGPSGARTDTAA
jgi:CDP-diacylglycerol--glycerol-3-phosphate 3-phosphatidyltransferase